jgi:hypothetical protein
MKTLYIVSLLVAFVVAVISAHDDVGTDELPGRPAKTTSVKAAGHDSHKARGHGHAALIAIEELECDRLAGCSDNIVWRSVQTVSNFQLSSPLLI